MIFLIAWLAKDEVEEIYHELQMYKWRIYPTLKSHLSDFWNLMDIATLGIASGLLYLQFYQFDVVEDLLKDPKNMDSSKLQNMGFWATQGQSIAGVQALVLWLKVFKFVAVTHKLEKLFEALYKSIPAAMDLLFVYFIIIVAFAVSGHIIFGSDVPLFDNMTNSFWSSVRVALFGDYDWDSMYLSNRVLGPIWIFLFMLASGIFLINFLVGIFCEVYAEVMSEEDDGKKSLLDTAINKFVDILQLKKLHAKIQDIEAKMGDMDADGDGMVSKVELAEFLTREGAYEIFDASEVTEVMHRFDKDGNGHLSPDEMIELRAVLQKRKAQLESEMGEEEGGGDSSHGKKKGHKPAGPVGPAQIQAEVKHLSEIVHGMQDKLERSTMIEKKMLMALESLTIKVDSLVSRETDFKYLRSSVNQDWIK